MATAWYRMRPRPGADAADLASLARQQAISFQSMPTFWVQSPWSVGPGVLARLAQRVHGGACGDAAARLASLLDIADSPGCMREAGHPLDHYWITAVIGGEVVLPPLWRMMSYRTMLPTELTRQLAEWRTWVADVRRGRHLGYVLELFLHDRSWDVWHHWHELRQTASDLRRVPLKLRDVRRAVLELPEPAIYEVAIEPGLDTASVSRGARSREVRLYREQRRLVELSEAWDRLVPLAQRRAGAIPWDRTRSGFGSVIAKLQEDDSLDRFFGWAEACAAAGFGLFLEP